MFFRKFTIHFGKVLCILKKRLIKDLIYNKSDIESYLVTIRFGLHYLHISVQNDSCVICHIQMEMLL